LTTPEQSEVRDGMHIDWDTPIVMDDGIVLRADVFRPLGDAKCPVVLSYGVYGKGLAFQEGNTRAWERLIAAFPEVAAGSTNKYQCWEVVDPEKWVPDGYAVVRVDSRGAGRSPGFLDIWSPRETQDLYQCIEWAAVQPWSNGKIGLNGISYYAMNQWYVASLQPPHLAAICVWEGAADSYRDITRHGGIYCQFLTTHLYPRSILRVQHGRGDRGFRSRVTGELVAGPETLPEETLAQNRVDAEAWVLEHALDDEAHRARSPVWEKVTVPLLSAANWGGQGLHPRGNFEGYLNSASGQKWLEVHGYAHWVSFYTDYGVALQKRFFGHFLKGEDTGWNRQPPVLLQVRHVDRFVERHENEWPLARTQWTRFYLEASDCGLRREAAGQSAVLEYDALGDGLLFLTPPLTQETEITGPVAAKLYVSSSTTDADLFLALRLFAPDGREIVFEGSNDPRVPIGLGWLRASHRKLDPKRSTPYRPYHAHDEKQPLTPGQPVELDVEIWPTCIVAPKGYRIGLSVRGKDYENICPPLAIPGVPYPLSGVGPFLHDHPQDRPREIFGGKNALHFDARMRPYLLLPIIPQSTAP
jgi:predicted acyl esterase